MTSSLKDKRILVVGGSAGIGLAVAKRACRAGAQILIASRTAKEKQGFLVETVSQDVKLYSFDATSEAETTRLFEETGRIDHLMISIRPPQPDPSGFPDIDIDQARLAFETKFWGQFRLMQTACKHIEPHGSVTMITGIAGERVYKGALTMAVINSATESLCRSLAVELAPLRVNTVSPGFIAPKPENTERLAAQFPAGALGRAEDVAEACIHLMSNPYVTGTSVAVDGGARLI